MTDLIPGDGWVTEHLADNGTRTVLPLVAWQVISGQLYPLPKPQDDTWVVRPRMPDDERLIRVTALSLQPKPEQTNQPTNWNRMSYLR
jgi:hypothetical protein